MGWFNHQLASVLYVHLTLAAGTTVIAVRGTLNALDVLHDVTLWLVPAVLQCLGRWFDDGQKTSWQKT